MLREPVDKADTVLERETLEKGVLLDGGFDAGLTRSNCSVRRTDAYNLAVWLLSSYPVRACEDAV